MSHRPDHDTPDELAPDDPGSDSLDRVRAELAALGAPPMPADVTARIGAALMLAAGDGSSGDGSAGDGSAGRRTTEGTAAAEPTAGAGRLRSLRGPREGSAAAARRGRRPRPDRPGRALPALLAGLAAAVVAGVTAVAVTVGAPAAPRVASEESDLQAAGAGALGVPDAGALTDPVLRRSCLTAAGAPDAGAPLLGGRPYTVRGEPGTLLVLGSGVRGRFRLVVVDTGCGPGGGRLLASATAGR